MAAVVVVAVEVVIVVVAAAKRRVPVRLDGIKGGAVVIFVPVLVMFKSQ